jgi:hypothetical protein
MGIEPHFDLWSHFFRIWLSQHAEEDVFGGTSIYVNSRHGVDPYFHLPMSESMDGMRNYGSFLGTTPMCRSPCS